MEIYQVLRKDHQKLKEIANAIAGTTERADQKRERLFHEFKIELEAHARLEEELFYEELKRKEKSRHAVLKSIEEHLVATILLNELDKLPCNTEQWTAKFSVLRQNLFHHIDKEESELFKLARAVFKEDKAEELGNAMAYRKEEMLAVL